jgi:hypothetical protein
MKRTLPASILNLLAFAECMERIRENNEHNEANNKPVDWSQPVQNVMKY